MGKDIKIHRASIGQVNTLLRFSPTYQARDEIEMNCKLSYVWNCR